MSADFDGVWYHVIVWAGPCARMRQISRPVNGWNWITYEWYCTACDQTIAMPRDEYSDCPQCGTRLRCDVVA